MNKNIGNNCIHGEYTIIAYALSKKIDNQFDDLLNKNTILDNNDNEITINDKCNI